MAKIYLASYDLYLEVLEYDPDSGAAAIIARADFERLGVPFAFGRFTREGSEVMGVFASPEGPVFFLGRHRVVGRFGEIRASVTPTADATGDERHFRFTLYRGAELEFVFDYRERHGIGTNPYDIEPEDVDWAASIAAGVRREEYFKNYTR